MKPKYKNQLFTILAVLWTCVIFSFSLQTGERSGQMSGFAMKQLLAFVIPSIQLSTRQLALCVYILRKFAHFTEFLILGILIFPAVSYRQIRYKTFTALGLCVMVAVVDEILQLFVGGRAGRVQDVLIDSAGALVGISIIYVTKKMVRRKK